MNKVYVLIVTLMLSGVSKAQTIVETISSGTSGDAVLRIEADTDNNNEGDNSWIEIKQDGGQLGAFIGFNQEWGSDNLFRIVPRYLGVNNYDRFIINGANGNVGIGTTNPLASFNVQAFSTTIGWNDLTKASILIGNSGTGIGIDSNEIASKGGPLYIGTINPNDDLILRAGGTATRFLIDGTTGNVGLGTSSPVTAFELDAGTTTEEVVALFTRGKSDSNFRGGFANGSGNTVFSEHSKVGLFYSSNWASTTPTDIAHIGFHRGGSANSDGISFNNNGAVNMIVKASGNVGIGTTTPDSKLTVAGKVHAQEVKVTITAGADFVFEDTYQPPTLKEIENFIKVNKHLPEMASAKEMETEGLELGIMNIKLLQKIEELTLYTLEQERKLNSQNENFNQLEKEVQQLKQAFLKLTNTPQE